MMAKAAIFNPWADTLAFYKCFGFGELGRAEISPHLTLPHTDGSFLLGFPITHEGEERRVSDTALAAV
ncbi:MAG: hypothetical protein J0I08_05730 [Rhizobiales bacterium]|nr:hypothetical protein [Hyphomicrobiales bacterium]